MMEVVVQHLEVIVLAAPAVGSPVRTCEQLQAAQPNITGGPDGNEMQNVQPTAIQLKLKMYRN